MCVSLQVATLDWLEKKAAAALYESPPSTTLHDALENFLKVDTHTHKHTSISSCSISWWGFHVQSEKRASRFFFMLLVNMTLCLVNPQAEELSPGFSKTVRLYIAKVTQTERHSAFPSLSRHQCVVLEAYCCVVWLVVSPGAGKHLRGH